MGSGKGRRVDEANISAESNSAKARPWISSSDELTWRSRHLEAAAGEGSKAPRGHNSVEIAVSAPTGRFERADRLLRPQDFQRVARDGRRIASRQFVILMGPTRQTAVVGKRRLGVTVSRRVGNSVVRNRIKRAVREWFRRNRESLKGQVDLVVIARQSAQGLSKPEIGKVLGEMLFSSEKVRG